jgi:hypothetical protein
MRVDLKSAVSFLALPATTAWREGVWDKTVFEHGTLSLIVFAPHGRDYQTTRKQDELYIVMKGSGTLLIEDTAFPSVEGGCALRSSRKAAQIRGVLSRLRHLGHLLGSSRRRKGMSKRSDEKWVLERVLIRGL